MSITRSASSGRPYLNPNDTTVNDARRSGAECANARSTSARNWCTESSEVSTTTSASSRNGSSTARSAATPSASLPPPCNGCERRLASYRRMSAASLASRNSTLGRYPRMSRSLITAARSSVNARDLTSSTIAIRVTSPLVREPRSTMVVISSGGRLSTTNQPMSSRHFAAVDRPAPDSPETIATWIPAFDPFSCEWTCSAPPSRETRPSLAAAISGPSRYPVAEPVDRHGGFLRARRRYRYRRRHCCRHLRSSAPGRPDRADGRLPGPFGECGDHRLGCPTADPWNLEDVLDARPPQGRHRPEMPDERLAPDLAETCHVVQRGHRHRLRALGPVVSDREPVRLVPQPLQQVQRLAGPREDDRLVLCRDPDLLEPLGQPADRDVDDAQLGEFGRRGIDLRSAAVDHQQLRRVGEPARPAGGRVDAAPVGRLVVRDDPVLLDHRPCSATGAVIAAGVLWNDIRRGLGGVLLRAVGEPPPHDLGDGRDIVARMFADGEPAVVAAFGQPVLEHHE